MIRKRAGLAALIALLVCGTGSMAAEMPSVPKGFTITRIATIPGAREIVVAPNGDLLAGTSGPDIYIVQGADGNPSAPHVFVHINDAPAAGVAIAAGSLYVGSQFGVWHLPYRTGDAVARSEPRQIAKERPSGISSDHLTTTVALGGGKLFASVGSSCNNCRTELDDTRATIGEMNLDGTHRTLKAEHIRNAIALAFNPATGTLWAGVAGQDELAAGHPFEIFDAVTLHGGTADYGWPYCYENRRTVSPAHNCSQTVIPRAVFPAYETPIGAVFYPANAKGRYAFPRSFWGGAFVTLHGSWHRPLVPPRVAFVPMHGDDPSRSVRWDNPNAQWTEFMGGFQDASGTRIARPTGIAVGSQGDLFVAEDYGGAIYRIRPVR